MDPRIRRRRAEARREEGRRRLRRILAGLGAFCAAVGFVVVLHSPLMAVRHAMVEGNTRTPAHAVLAAAGLLPVDPAVPLVDVSSERRARAVEALPWVRQVAFHRRWPWGVVVQVQERSPVAVVAAGRSLDVIDDTGRVLETLPLQARASVASALRSAGLPPVATIAGARPAAPGQPVVPGAGSSEQALVAMERAAAACPRDVALSGLTLHYSTSNGLTALAGPTGATVVLGSSDQLTAKLAVLGELEAHGQLPASSLVDLTVPLRPTVSAPNGNGGNG